MLEYKFDTGPIKHDLIAGVEIGHDSYTNQAYTRNNLPIVPMLNPPIIEHAVQRDDHGRQLRRFRRHRNRRIR